MYTFHVKNQRRLGYIMIAFVTVLIFACKEQPKAETRKDGFTAALNTKEDSLLLDKVPSSVKIAATCSARSISKGSLSHQPTSSGNTAATANTSARWTSISTACSDVPSARAKPRPSTYAINATSSALNQTHRCKRRISP